MSVSRRIKLQTNDKFNKFNKFSNCIFCSFFTRFLHICMVYRLKLSSNNRENNNETLIQCEINLNGFSKMFSRNNINKSKMKWPNICLLRICINLYHRKSLSLSRARALPFFFCEDAIFTKLNLFSAYIRLVESRNL